jgi:hypothetical protein
MALPGENEILTILNVKNLNLCQYDEVIDIHIEKTYDDISSTKTYNGYLIVTDGYNKIKIDMKKIKNHFSFYFGDHLDGFDIEDCIAKGYESENRYHIYDYESYDNLNIYCEDLYISLIK